MTKFTRRMLSIMIASSLAACGGGGSGGASTSSQGGGAASQYRVAGQVQKGPFIFGSQIWISELNDKLSPTGKVYMTQTSDDLGNFSIPGSVDSKLVELTGSGYYMNELSGTLSTAPVTLNAVADLSISKSLTINLLTTLQAPRLKALMAGGNDYQTAYKQSRNEVLAIFGIDSGKVDNLGSLFDMRINGTADQDSILLATSAILSKVAQNRDKAPGPDGWSHPPAETAELSHLISTIASELANTGKLSSQPLYDQLKLAATQIDLDSVRRNVETYYAGRGIKVVAPKFEEWVDKDNSGILPRRLVPVAGISFNDIQDADPTTVYKSNSIKISGIGAGKSIPVNLTGGTTLIKNGTTSSSTTTAKDGDTFEIQASAPFFGSTTESTLQAGSTRTLWKVASRATQLMYDNTNSPSPTSPNFIISTGLKYAATVFKSDHDFNAKYLGMEAAEASDFNVSIYSDANGTPGQELISSNSKINLFGATPTPSVKNDVKKSFIQSSPQFYFGSNGIKLEKGKIYWLVLKSNTEDGIKLTTAPGDLTYNNNGVNNRYSLDGKNWNTCPNGSPFDASYPPNSYSCGYIGAAGLYFIPSLWLAK